MNAQQIWPGTDYAMGYRRKGGPLPLDAQRVKVRQIIKEPIYNGKRDRTYVEVMIVNDETGMPDDIDNLIIKRVSGRDILEFWDEYFETVEDEREEYQEKQREAERQRIEREIKRKEENAVWWVGNFLRGSWLKELDNRKQIAKAEAEAKRKQRETRLKNVLIGRGLKPEGFWIVGEQINIKFDEMERWLGF
jgi:DNA-binding ferritin-like protein (Dps family)